MQRVADIALPSKAKLWKLPHANGRLSQADTRKPLLVDVGWG
jgi:hypothetical protein